MQTFDQGLFNLYEKGTIGYTEALAHADSANDLRLMIKLNSAQDRRTSRTGSLDDVTIGC